MATAMEQQLLQAARIVEEQLDTEIEKLDKLDEDELEVLKRKRLEGLKKQETQKKEWLALGHGEYTELADEKEFFDACKKSKNFVCHFYRDATVRCKIMDKHLDCLSKKHLETRFCKIDAERSVFLAEKLKIRVLPTVVLCKDSKTRPSIVGFDELGGVDDFSTEILEWRIAQAGVINYAHDLSAPPGAQRKTLTVSSSTKTIRGRNASDEDSD